MGSFLFTVDLVFKWVTWPDPVWPLCSSWLKIVVQPIKSSFQITSPVTILHDIMGAILVMWACLYTVNIPSVTLMMAHVLTFVILPYFMQVLILWCMVFVAVMKAPSPMKIRKKLFWLWVKKWKQWKKWMWVSPMLILCMTMTWLPPLCSIKWS